ncbi:DUF1540 domain-containing protein [Clostridium sp. MT-14]|jgi:hypothetical protein|uniref:DUF1540 domain-containing protein n=1 Tax=Clostridium aromativorans TaxID=2836848 RepID=A0ABS8N9J3_9CLOT|nr:MULTISPECIES: DUF1540 domain-containing protein [Clostridium]KAA8662877.1 DUF1540 domain-containing protein [Clostridium sp. HV4-5-A1G]MCC9296492.1 DUF1540 domain-containing protein [Clostridium aromativorans]CAB1262790.1 conserved hypothetical protein [Clostridiaceae bacterium BL-3]
MNLPKMEVKCSVDCCNYWKDNHCNADALEVNSMRGKKPDTSDDTCCTTFKPFK